MILERVQSLEHSGNEDATHEGLEELFREAVFRTQWAPAILISALPQFGSATEKASSLLSHPSIQHKGILGQGSSFCSRHSAWGFHLYAHEPFYFCTLFRQAICKSLSTTLGHLLTLYLPEDSLALGLELVVGSREDLAEEGSEPAYRVKVGYR